MKRSVYGNGAKNDFSYDGLGRLEKVEYLTGSNSVLTISTLRTMLLA
ncbi:hypothetical protein IT570_02610 [Candidatus Sumerlaeota bacterium]|nr:hypothetical protein [Candidatus Sumerlaeota bacterium]